MKTNKINIVSIILIMAFAVSSVQVIAQQGREMRKVRVEKRVEKKEFRKERMHEMLDLSEEQKEQIKKLRLEHQKAMLPIKNLFGEQKAKMQTLRTAEKVDLKAIDKLVDDMTGLRAKQMKMQVRHEQEVRSLLTEEQRIMFDTHKNKRKHKPQRSGRGERMRKHY
jgi:Spy/CpxP family protein refolding chaperone